VGVVILHVHKYEKKVTGRKKVTREKWVLKDMIGA
jgi:hypothetical protein